MSHPEMAAEYPAHGTVTRLPLQTLPTPAHLEGLCLGTSPTPTFSQRNERSTVYCQPQHLNSPQMDGKDTVISVSSTVSPTRSLCPHALPLLSFITPLSPDKVGVLPPPVVVKTYSFWLWKHFSHKNPAISCYEFGEAGDRVLNLSNKKATSNQEHLSGPSMPALHMETKPEPSQKPLPFSISKDMRTQGRGGRGWRKRE